MPPSVFLSAPPGAGKTYQLERWHAEAPDRRRYLALTRDDADPAFFLHRFLQPWPALAARFEQLRSTLSASEPGAVLGLALSEVMPEDGLLLDDFHLAEDTPLETLLQGLIRHFPATGSLAIASRHLPPKLERQSLAHWDAEHPGWQGRARLEDLLDLPVPLQAQVLALQLVGAFGELPDGDELIRRNLAQRDAAGLLVLQAAWHDAAIEAVERGAPQGVWDLIARGLKAQGIRHFRTHQASAARAILRQVPPEVRTQHAIFLRLEAAALFEAGMLEGGWMQYQQALALCAAERHERLDTLLEMASSASNQRDLERYEALLAELTPHEAALTPLQRARYLNLKAWKQWLVAETDEVHALWQEVLAITPSGDRLLHYEHYLALLGLHVTHNNQGLRLEATRYAERLLSLVVAQNFETRLLEAHNARLRSHLLDPQGLSSIQVVLQIPPRAFEAPSPDAVLNFVSLLGSRALRAQAHQAAYAYFQYMKARAIRQGATAFVQMSNLHLLEIACYQGRYVEARLYYDELSRLALDNDQRNYMRLTWACALAAQGETAEALALLQTELDAQPLEDLRASVFLLAQKLAGEAVPAPAVLSRPSLRRGYWHEAFDGAGWPSMLSCQAFGDLRLLLDGTESLKLSRHKALMLLGYLALNPDGIPSETLAEHLFEDPDELNQLHSAAHSLRQGLKKLEAGHLLEAAGGLYRLRWDDVAFCDLHEFEALYRKGRELENEGLTAGARLFFELAIAIASPPMFGNLPDAFDSARAAHAGKLRHARAFIEQPPS